MTEDIGQGMILLRIEEAMRLRDLTVSQLSSLSGLSRPTIYKLKTEAVSRIEFDTLARLCHVLRLPIGKLIYYRPIGEDSSVGEIG